GEGDAHERAEHQHARDADQVRVPLPEGLHLASPWERIWASAWVPRVCVPACDWPAAPDAAPGSDGGLCNDPAPVMQGSLLVTTGPVGPFSRAPHGMTWFSHSP